MSTLAVMPSACDAYAAELEDTIRVPAGGVVRVRPLCRGEDGPIRELYSRLSPDARYHRFFSTTPAAPESVVRLLSDVDYRRRVALVAYESAADRMEIVGLADFAALDERTAEVGIVVRDDWHRRRLGTGLAARLLRAASARGFDRFVGRVLTGNQAVRRLIPHVAVVRSATVSAGEVELHLVRRP